MRQAFIVKNPKWEPFSKVSDAFKKLSATEPAVLIVRGRCKEKKNKVLAKAAVAVALLLGLCLPAFAQQNLIGYLPATSVTSFSTNWTAGTGLIGINRDQIAVFQLTATATNTLASGNTIVRLDTSDNGTDWLTNQVTVAVTNNATAIARMTNSIGGKWYRIGGVSNLGTGTTNDSSIVRFSISIQ
jgi:hypothetical protein